MNDLELTQKQRTIVAAIEKMMIAAGSEGIGFACDEMGLMYAYNATNVSCFDASPNAAYDHKDVIRMEDLCRIHYGHIDYAPSNEDIIVGMMAD